jgi:hypothetical protein
MRGLRGRMRKMLLRALGLAATIAAALATGEAGAANLVVVNQSGYVLNELYVSPCAGRHWGPNQLTGTLLESSRSFTVSNMRPGCYDLKVVLPFWNECTVNGTAIFKNLVWTLTWSLVTEGVFANCSRTAHIVPTGRPWLPYDREN